MYIFPTANSGILFLSFAVDFFQGDEGGSKKQGYSQNQFVWHIRVQGPVYCNTSSTSPQRPLGDSLK